MTREPGPAAGRKLLPIEAAGEIVLGDVAPLEIEVVPLLECRGRFAAESVTSKVDLPGFDNSVMDGYAVRAADTTGATTAAPVTLEIIGESRAGAPEGRPVGTGQAIGISTGAMIPEGADSVLQMEVVGVEGTDLVVTTQVDAGHDVRKQGEVVGAGSEVIAPGTRLGPVEIGVLSATGHDRITCRRRPRVALLTSGDELVEPGTSLGPGQIWDSNRAALTASINESGAELVAVETVPDDREATVEALDHALGADLTVICGGVSVGEHDHVKPALAKLEVEQLFWGLALKPGRPTWFGRRGDSRVLGLPGNPVSALVVFRLLGMPLLDALAGGRAGNPRKKATLMSPVRRRTGRLHAVPCRPAAPDRPLELVPMPQLGSHDLLSLQGATCLALIEPGTGQVEAGEVVETLSLGDG
ncbi:MAG: molybdopterin molybdotransferase MoeA [Solirubrobacterales bacterium]